MISRMDYPQLQNLIIAIEIASQLYSYRTLSDIVDGSSEIYAPFDINIRKLKDEIVSEGDNVLNDTENILYPIKDLQDLYRRCYIRYYKKVVRKYLHILINNLLVRYIRKNNIFHKYENITLVDFIQSFINTHELSFSFDDLITEFNEKFSLDK